MAKTKKTTKTAAVKAEHERLDQSFANTVKTPMGVTLWSMAASLYEACRREYRKQVRVRLEMREPRDGGVFHFGFELATAEVRFEVVIRPGVIEFYTVDATACPGGTPEFWCKLFSDGTRRVAEWADPKFDEVVASIISQTMGGAFPKTWFKC